MQLKAQPKTLHRLFHCNPLYTCYASIYQQVPRVQG